MATVSKKPWFIRLAQPTYGRWLLWHHKIETIGIEAVAALSPPFLVLSNHAHAMDSFIISAASPHHIRWVAGSYLFRLFGLRPLLQRWVGAISKTQDQSDIHTIRAIGQALKGGDVVGLFPEGTRTWDGEPVGFEPAIAKLIAIFKVPVVLFNLEGFYALKPRWARYRRRGTPRLRLVKIISVDEIKGLDTASLYALLTESLGYSYRAQQVREPLAFTGRRNAEGLQALLYLCPQCKRASTIKTHNQTIECSACSLSLTLDEHERLRAAAAPFDGVDQWHRWQRDLIGSDEGKDLVFPTDNGVLFQRIEGDGLVTLSRRFGLTLNAEGLLITPHKGGEVFLPFSAITSTVINAKSTLEITCSAVRYRIRIEKGGSIIKYLEYSRQWAPTTVGGMQ